MMRARKKEEKQVEQSHVEPFILLRLVKVTRKQHSWSIFERFGNKKWK